MRIGQRLFLAVLPAVLGLFLVAALAYWGQYAQRVPPLLVIVAAVAAVASLLVSWHNARYVTSRIERLAGAQAHPRPGPRDEIDTIESAVDRLSSEVTIAREEGAQRESRAVAHREELSALLATVTESAMRAIDEVRLPVHILLANRFGDLNENQEEMLGAAQSAVDQAAALLGRVHLIAELDRGSLELRRDPVRLDDVVNAAIPALRAEAKLRQIEVSVDLAPALPRVITDRTHFQDAIATLLRSAVRRTADGGVVTIAAQREGAGVCLTIEHGTGDAAGVELAIARRLIVAVGGRVEEGAAHTRIDMPATQIPTS
jgi:signal transduction histidine kinase